MFFYRMHGLKRSVCDDCGAVGVTSASGIGGDAISLHHLMSRCVAELGRRLAAWVTSVNQIP